MNKCLSAIALLVLCGAGALYYQFVTNHTSQFNSVSDRQSVPQLMFEGLDIVYRNRQANTAWAKAYHDAHNLTGQVIILTGATKGLGRGIASHLASFGAKLVLPCRRCDFVKQRAQLYNDAVRNKYRTSRTPLEHFAEPLYFDVDLADLEEIDSMLTKLKEMHLPQASALILNAGLVSTSNTTTKQGFETTFGVNFISSAYLTQQALQLGLLQDNARIISVSSEDHRVATPISQLMEQHNLKFGQPWGTGVMDALPRYDYSKLAMTTYFLALARRHTSVQVIDMCPGPVDSEIIVSNVVWPIGTMVKHAISLFMIPIVDASIPVVRLALSGEFAGITGRHYHISEQRPARGDARDLDMQDKVYEWTQTMLETKKPPPVFSGISK